MRVVLGWSRCRSSGVPPADRAGGDQHRGVPDDGCQPADGDTVAVRAQRPDRGSSVREYAPAINKPFVVLSPRFLSADERAVMAHEHDRGRTVQGHRGAAQAQPVDGQPGAAAQQRPSRGIPAGPRAPARPPQAPAAPAAAARLRWRAAGVRPAAPGRAVEPGADRGHPAPRVARRPTPSAVKGKPVPGAVCPRHGAGRQPAHRPPPATTTAAG